MVVRWLKNKLKVNKYLYGSKNIIIVGDYNICHTEKDIARPKENANNIGFLPIERAKITHFLSHGFTDVFRHFNPDARDQYTWRSYSL
jgi:exodeoxyribonuclease-3